MFKTFRLLSSKHIRKRFIRILLQRASEPYFSLFVQEMVTEQITIKSKLNIVNKFSYFFYKNLNFRLHNCTAAAYYLVVKLLHSAENSHKSHTNCVFHKKKQSSFSAMKIVLHVLHKKIKFLCCQSVKRITMFCEIEFNLTKRTFCTRFPTLFFEVPFVFLNRI